jgi:hypothetical protein
MADPLPRETPEVQAKVLRKLADRLERDGGPALPGELEEALVRELEDRIDLDAVRERRDEQAIPWEQVKAELGL